MNVETMIGIIAVVLSAVGGLLAYYTRTNDARMDNAFRRIEVMEAHLARLPDTYSRRDDVAQISIAIRDLSAALFNRLERIEDKLDKKADK